MIYHLEDIRDLLGTDVDLSPDLIRAIINFTLVFSLAEQKLMDGRGSIMRTEKYAEIITDQYGMTLESEFDYFRHRYIGSQNAKSYLDALCHKKPNDREKVFTSLTKDNPSERDKAEAVLNVCIRLRHNLFHGNKWHYEIRGQEENLETVTRMLSEYLNRAAER